jgi:hypothetical protein
MQLTGLVALGLLALKVTAIGTDSGSDVDARDFSGETLQEFDVRTPDEEAADLEARTDYNYNKCGTGAYWKHNSCKCYKKWEKYDATAKRCYKPLECKGKNVIVEGYGYGNEKCVCTLDNQKYDEHEGCKCVEGYSLKHGKCVKDCAYGELYSEEHGCYTPCKGKKVTETWSGYPPVLTCVCKVPGAVYSEHEGCQCPTGTSLKHGKCVKDCAYGEEYSKEHDACYVPCKGKYVKDEWSGYPAVHTCTCKKPGFIYDESKGGCYYPCPADSTYDWHAKECKCDTYGFIIKDDKCVAPCVGENVKYEHGKCKCLNYGDLYDEVKGCQPRCPADQKYSWKKKECECKDYKKIIKDGVCVAPCVGEGYFYKHGHCYCKAKDQEYDATVGCKNRCAGDAKYNFYKGECECPKDKKYVEDKGCVPRCDYGKVYDWKHKKCYSPCKKPHQVIEWHYGYPKCVCEKGYKATRWGCEKKKHGGYY